MLNRFWMKFPLMDETGGETGAGGATAAPVFDPNKFAADLLGKIDAKLNGIDKKWSKQFEAIKPTQSTTQQTEQQEAETTTTSQSTQVDPKLAAFERRANDATKKLEAAEARAKKIEEDSLKRESDARQRVLSSELKTELAKYVDPAKLGAAYKMYDRDVKYNEDGQMVGPDDTPMSEYIKREMGIRENEYLLTPKQVGGAGATTGQARSAAVDLDKLKPGMDPGELAKIRAEISRVATATMAGQTIL